MSACNYQNTIISIDEFNAFSGNYEASDEVVALKYQILKSAQQVVESYLNYSLDSQTCIDEHVGCNNNRIYLNARPVAQVHWVRVNGLFINDYGFDSKSIYLTDDKVFEYRDRVMIEYETSINAAPPIIKQTILRIATLMLTEANENIGVTSVSAPDGMGRTFLNYTSYAKYLEPLADYKVYRL